MLKLKWGRNSKLNSPETRAVVIRPGAVFKCCVFLAPFELLANYLLAVFTKKGGKDN